MLSIGGTSPMAMEAHTRNWGLYEETARANGHVPDRKNWRVVGMFHIAETREQARKNVQFGVQAFANYFRDVATFPIIPPDVPDPDRVADRDRHRLHRHPRRRDRLCRAADRRARAGSACCASWRRTGPIGTRPRGTTS